MLALIFFVLIFSSFLWLFFSVSFIAESLNGISFLDAGMANIMLYTLLVCLPVFLLWAVFGYINQYLQNQKVSVQLQKLWGQLKKNQDYSDLIARALIEAKQNVNDGFMLARIDLFISELNELLSEIIKGCKFASSEQIDSLWTKVRNGGKWSFGKVIIEVNNSQPDFSRRVLEYCVHNQVLGGTVMEFCARYNSILKLLEVHDKDKLFLEILETGVMGKVCSVLMPIASELHRVRNLGGVDSEEMPKPIVLPEIRVSRQEVVDEPEVSAKPNRFSVLGKFNPFKKKEDVEETEIVKDPFSIALERSFTNEKTEEVLSASETRLEPEISFSAEVELEPEVELRSESVEDKKEVELLETDTQKMLDSLKKEWSDHTSFQKEDKINLEAEETDIIYPFGNWTDEQSYQK